MRAVRQRMGMVFQNFELFPHRTALQNVEVGPLTVLGMPRDEAASRAKAVLDKVGLADKANKLPRQPLRRPATARGYRPRARHGTGSAAVR